QRGALEPRPCESRAERLAPRSRAGEREEARQRGGGQQVLGREPRTVAEHDGGGIDADDVEEERPLRLEPALPPATLPALGAGHPGELLRDPVLARLEETRDDRRERGRGPTGDGVPAFPERRGLDRVVDDSN